MHEMLGNQKCSWKEINCFFFRNEIYVFIITANFKRVWYLIVKLIILLATPTTLLYNFKVSLLVLYYLVLTLSTWVFQYTCTYALI